MSRHQSLRFTLLDQQIVDSDGLPVGRVDDLLLREGQAGQPPAVTHVLVGAQALGERLGGAHGRMMAWVAGRFRTGAAPSGPARIPAGLVGDHEDLVHLVVPLQRLPDVAGLERWLSTNLVQHVPGAGDAGQ